jgi:hypothetical protein
MKTTSRCLPWLATACASASLGHAAIVVPLSYTATPGEGMAQGGSFNYFDDGDQQLLDGILGVDDWSADLGNGPAFEWVGYQTVDPSFSFAFTPGTHIENIALHANNLLSGGVGLFGQAQIQTSLDGEVFSLASVFTPSAAQNATTTAQWINIPVSIDVPFVRITTTDGLGSWQFYSEIQFADTAVVVPETSGYALIAGSGLAAFALWRRRDSGRTPRI